MKRKKLLLLIPAFALLALLLYKPAYNLYRDISFSWEERSPEAMEVKAFAESHNLSIGEYPWEIIGLYETNPETKEFVLNYPFREKHQHLCHLNLLTKALHHYKLSFTFLSPYNRLNLHIHVGHVYTNI